MNDWLVVLVLLVLIYLSVPYILAGVDYVMGYDEHEGFCGGWGGYGGWGWGGYGYGYPYYPTYPWYSYVNPYYWRPFW